MSKQRKVIVKANVELAIPISISEEATYYDAYLKASHRIEKMLHKADIQLVRWKNGKIEKVAD